jgi:hypothetical protein
MKTSSTRRTLALAATLGLASAACAPTTPRGGERDDAAERALADDPTASVTGTVVEAATGEPIAGVDVTGPGGARARTDKRGRFVLAGLAAGSRGPLVAELADGRRGEVRLLPLAAGRRLEVVVHVR